MSCPAGGITRGVPPPRLELATILRDHPPGASTILPRKQQAVRAITRCRTAAMGGRVEECDRCGHHEILYNSCRDRHCPKCQAMEQARWVEARMADLLPVEYYHIVFTVPHVLHDFFHRDPSRSFGHLFAAVSSTLLEVAANPERLNAHIGFIAILHTWTQTLQFHPHVHCVVPGGGISTDGGRWIPSRFGFFLPVKVLSRVFRGKLLRRFEQESSRSPEPIPEAGDRLRQAARQNWTVYAKPPFGGPDRVIKYLGRYTHRIAISNSRLVSLNDGIVTFRYQDRRDRNRPKTMALDASEFVRRLLQHVLPRGFVRIRHYGFLANRNRATAVPLIRSCLSSVRPSSGSFGPTGPPPARDPPSAGPEDHRRCPRCDEGRLVLTLLLPPIAQQRWATPGRATSP